MSLILPTMLLRALSVGSIPIMAPDLGGRGGRIFLSTIQEGGRVKKGFCFAEVLVQGSRHNDRRDIPRMRWRLKKGILFSFAEISVHACF